MGRILIRRTVTQRDHNPERGGNNKQLLAGIAAALLSSLAVPAIAAAPVDKSMSCDDSGRRQTELALLRKASLANDADLLGKLGEFYRSNPSCDGDHARAMHFFERGAKGGDGWAMIGLARMLLAGEGATADPARAIELLEAAALEGLEAPALTEIGEHFRKAGDFVRALEYFQRASEAGSGWAMRAAAEMTLAGSGVSPNPRVAIELLNQAAETDARGPALTTLGGYYRSIGDFAAALQNLEEAASLGDPSAKKALGEMLLAGTEVEPDEIRAIALLEAAAAQGLGGSPLITLSAHFGKAGNQPLALNYLERAVAAGDASARVLLASRLFTGKDAPADPIRAVGLLQEAAATGLIGPAMSALGVYYRGIGDQQKAAEAFKRSAETGDASAAVAMAEMLLLGTGMEADPERAIVFLGPDRAGRLSAQASRFLGDYYRSIERFDDAIAAFLHASDLGDAWAIKNAAEMFLNGEGIEQDTERGIFLLNQAVQAGLKGPALNALGDHYRLSGNYGPAVAALQDAADAGEPWAMKSLAEMYLAGHGVPKDATAADRLLDRAAQLPPKPPVPVKWVADPASTYTGEKIAMERVLSAAFKAGFRTEEKLLPAVALAVAESGLWSQARNWQPRKGLRPVQDPITVLGPPKAWSADGRQMHSDRGLWQISSYWWSQYSDEAADDPDTAAVIAFKVSNGGSEFVAWDSFRSGYAEELYDEKHDGWPALRPIVQTFLAAELLEEAPPLPGTQNIDHALKLLQKAADSGLPGPALVTMGNHYRSKRDYSQAFQKYEQAADAGDPWAMTYLADMLFAGEGTASDPKRALALLQRAGQLGLREPVADRLKQYDRAMTDTAQPDVSENVALVADAETLNSSPRLAENETIAAAAAEPLPVPEKTTKDDAFEAVEKHGEQLLAVSPDVGAIERAIPMREQATENTRDGSTLGKLSAYKRPRGGDIAAKAALSKAAKAGDLEATLLLGDILLNGSNRKDVNDQGLAMLNAISSGDAERAAQMLIGAYYRKIGRLGSSASAYGRALASGQDNAVVELASVLATGLLKPRQATEASSLINSAFAGGMSQASYREVVQVLSRNFQHPVGVQLAVDLLKQAATRDAKLGIEIFRSLTDNSKAAIIQQFLVATKGYAGPVNGLLDRVTLRAIHDFCKAHDIEECREYPMPDRLLGFLLDLRKEGTREALVD